MYKTNSKRKTLNGCCQMCIKTLKMSQNVENNKGNLHGSLESENGVWRKVEDHVVRLVHGMRPNSSGHFTLPLIIYIIATLPLKFTKMPLWISNVSSFTLMT